MLLRHSASPALWDRPAHKAWALLCLDGAMIVVTALFWIARGRFFSAGLEHTLAGEAWRSADALLPGVSRLLTAVTRMAGLAMLAMGALVMAIAGTALRRGQPWAWYALWVVPFFAVCDFAVLLAYDAVTLGAMLWSGTIFVSSVLGLMVASGAGPERDNRATV